VPLAGLRSPSADSIPPETSVTSRDRLLAQVLEEIDKPQNRIRLASATSKVTNLPRFEFQYVEGQGKVEPQYVP
jgi:hypothetical protein